jgi:hypothetical protein
MHSLPPDQLVNAPESAPSRRDNPCKSPDCSPELDARCSGENVNSPTLLLFFRGCFLAATLFFLPPFRRTFLLRQLLITFLRLSLVSLSCGQVSSPSSWFSLWRPFAQSSPGWAGTARINLPLLAIQDETGRTSGPKVCHHLSKSKFGTSNCFAISNATETNSAVIAITYRSDQKSPALPLFMNNAG